VKWIEINITILGKNKNPKTHISNSNDEKGLNLNHLKTI